MEFCLARTAYWQSVGFYTLNWRKSLNEEFSLVHREQAEVLVADVERDPEITLLRYYDTALTALLESSEWKPVEDTKEEPTN